MSAVRADALGHLGAFGDQLRAAEAAKNRTAMQESTHRKCHAVVMVLLALVAAGGGAALIIYSGGPAQFELFVSGVVLGGGASALLIWTAIDAVLSCRREQAAHAQHQQEVKKSVSMDEVLAALAKATPDGRVKTHQALTSEQRENLLEAALSVYFAADHTLTAGQQQTLLSFLVPDYILTQEQLAQVIPACLPALEAEASDAIKARLAAMSPEQRAAMHAHIMATYFPLAPIALREAQKALLAALDASVLETQAQNSLPGALGLLHNLDPIPQNVLTAIFTQIISSINVAGGLTYQELFDHFKGMSIAHQALFFRQLADANTHDGAPGYIIKHLLSAQFAGSFTETVTPDQIALLTQIGRYPVLVAQRIFITGTPLYGRRTFINALYDVMTQENQQAFVQASSEKPADLLLQVYPDDQSIPAFDAILVSRVKAKPELFNQLFQNVQRNALPLKVLQGMGEEAKTLIANLDKGVGGFSTYNRLITALNQRLPATGEVDPQLGKLVSYFKNAPQAGKVSILGVNAISPTGQGWERFEAIAKQYPPSG